MKDNISIYLKFFLCVLFIAFWSFWLTLPQEIPQKHPTIKSHSAKKRAPKEKVASNEKKEQINPPSQTKKSQPQINTQTTQKVTEPSRPQHKEIKKEEKITEKIIVLPPPEDIAIDKVQKAIPKDSMSDGLVKETNNTDNAVPKAETLQQNNQIDQSNTLRDKLFIDKSKQKVLIDEFKKDAQNAHTKTALDQSWIPLYIQKREEVKPTEASEFINDLKLVGVLNNNKGENVAVLKIQSLNQVKYLTSGDTLNEYTITNIESDKITLKDNLLKKEYTKEVESIKN